ncbi:PadR family transcriptional regulator [Acidiplasma cupricumulans]|uniref:PadR family transcriptional regulator n=1 Tax=Acidiplasma cupricumulans TaxID=312540 RepID=UPI0007867626|nr:PadR family transcriptional regulator [Acidiplasma cupricumulans]
MKAHISDLFILEQIYSTEKKPYDIIKGIRKKFDADYKPSTGMIYPSLKRLMGNNLITKNEGRYKITEAGIEYFNKNKENYEKMVENFTENKIFLGI